MRRLDMLTDVKPTGLFPIRDSFDHRRDPFCVSIGCVMYFSGLSSKSAGRRAEKSAGKLFQELYRPNARPRLKVLEKFQVCQKYIRER